MTFGFATSNIVVLTSELGIQNSILEIIGRNYEMS